MSSTHETPRSNSQESNAVPHSGVHGNEIPVETFKTPLEQAVAEGSVTSDSIITTNNGPAHDRLDTVKKVGGNFLRTKRGRRIALLAAGALLSATGGTAKLTGFIDNADTSRSDTPSSTGAEVPGPIEDSSSTVSDLPVPNQELSIVPAEVASQPMELSREQIDAWNNGDEFARNKVAAEVFAPRLEFATFQYDKGMQEGIEPDISYLTNDPESVYPILRTIVNSYTVSGENDATEAYYICIGPNENGQSPSYDANEAYPVTNFCNPAASVNENGVTTDVSSESMVLLMKRFSGSTGPLDDDVDHIKSFKFDAHLELDGNMLTMASEE